MQRLALALGLGAVGAAAAPSPGLYVALGLGIAAVGTGYAGYAQRSAPGGWRLAAAAAMAVGALGGALGAVRIGLALAALGHVQRLL
ncbi:MAG TPA: hypothetical protein VGM88_27340 [Kofleriaceae bacterium]|jgi:hypothetical protein